MVGARSDVCFRGPRVAGVLGGALADTAYHYTAAERAAMVHLQEHTGTMWVGGSGSDSNVSAFDRAPVQVVDLHVE